MPEKPLPRLRLLMMGTMLAAAALCAFLGLSTPLPASTYVILFYTYPALVALMSLFLGERLPLFSWVALGLTLTGCVLIVPAADSSLWHFCPEQVCAPAAHFTTVFGKSAEASSILGGAILALVNAVVVALYFIINNRLLRGHIALARASAWSISGALLVMLALAPTRPVTAPTQPNAWLLLVALAAFCTVLPVFSITSGIQKLGASRAAILGTLEPLLTLLWGTFLLGERMQPLQVVGGLFIVASIVLLQLKRDPLAPAPPVKVLDTLHHAEV